MLRERRNIYSYFVTWVRGIKEENSTINKAVYKNGVCLEIHVVLIHHFTPGSITNCFFSEDNQA